MLHHAPSPCKQGCNSCLTTEYGVGQGAGCFEWPAIVSLSTVLGDPFSDITFLFATSNRYYSESEYRKCLKSRFLKICITCAGAGHDCHFIVALRVLVFAFFNVFVHVLYIFILVVGRRSVMAAREVT